MLGWRHRVRLCRGVSCRVGEPAGVTLEATPSVTLEATPAATPQGKAATAAVYQWPSAGSGFAWGFSSRLSLPPRKRPVIHDRPPAGLFQSKPSPAATGLEGHPRRLFGVPRWVGGRAGCGFFASLAFRAQGALLQAAMYPTIAVAVRQERTVFANPQPN